MTNEDHLIADLESQIEDTERYQERFESIKDMVVTGQTVNNLNLEAVINAVFEKGSIEQGDQLVSVIAKEAVNNKAIMEFLDSISIIDSMVSKEAEEQLVEERKGSFIK